MTTDTLTADLRRLLTAVTDDLRGRSDRDDLPWAVALRAEYDDARRAGRTAFTWSQWRDGEIDQAAVAWVLGTVFVRFCEDNDLVTQRWIAGPGDGLRLAVDAESAFYAANPRAGTADWLHTAFSALADLPATGGILDRDHSLVWRITPGDDVCRDLLTYWRTTGDGGTLAHPLTTDDLDTRFLGDIYQDLSELAKKKYALLQTPDFVEEFILDRTLDPAIAEFGLTGLRLIDPTCGSGHFLLGAFGRLLAAWQEREPAVPAGENIRRALDSVYGVDLNPFAAAIARFRLAVAALKASGFRRLKDAPNWTIHVAVGDSLLGGMSQGALIDDQGAAGFHYRNEDITEYPRILESGRYHVVVGNPPYITVKDKALNEAYRQGYLTCKGKYALSVPFMELFFRLAIRGTADKGAGYVGQITSNSFMKREFGTKVIETLLSGKGGPSHIDQNPVDLLDVIDTSGAYIPGHGTPTVILIGRRRYPAAQTVHAVLGMRGEPGTPADPRKGLVWSEIVGHVDDPEVFDGDYVTVTDLPRQTLAQHPWSLSGGGAGDVKELIDAAAAQTLEQVVELVGVFGMTNADEVFLAPAAAFRRRRVESGAHRRLVIGESIRDFDFGPGDDSIFLYGSDGLERIEDEPGALRWLWPARTVTWARVTFNKVSYRAEGRTWWEWHQVALDRLRTPLSISFAEVATHNHFVLDRGGKVFKQTAPVIKLPADASLAEHLGLLGLLNSSTACFWLKQVSHNKGGSGIGRGIQPEDWMGRYQFNAAKLEPFPLSAILPTGYGFVLDALAQQSSANLPPAVLADDSARPSRAVLEAARGRWEVLRAQMIAWQEELDWHTYATYGLSDEALTYLPQPDPTAESIADSSPSTSAAPASPTSATPSPTPRIPALPPVTLGQRAFEIVLARRIAAGQESSEWFARHGSTSITDVPAEWPADYRDLVVRRIAAIEENPQIRLLERPEFKRRWAHESWESMRTTALRGYILDRLEDPALWSDAQGPRVLSVAALAEAVRHDEAVQAGIEVLYGPDADRMRVLGALVADEAVPFLAALRYTDAGMRKRAEWEAVWKLQRREDAGEEGPDIPVPPKYTNKDFRKASYWSARGKLDVPKERFISYPGGELGADSALVVGWAGWDHAEQARALARLLVTGVSQDGWDTERVTPMLAGLVELEPWLRQWHADPAPGFPTSPAQAIKGLLDQRLVAAGLTRADVAAWRPPAPARGRRGG